MVVYCTHDLIFATKIRSTAEAVGAVTRPARDAAMLEARLNRVDDGRANASVRAVIIDLDLAEQAIALVTQVKQHTSDLPVVVYGSHVAIDWLNSAREAGADHVMPRSQFVKQLPTMLKDWGSPKDDASTTSG